MANLGDSVQNIKQGFSIWLTQLGAGEVSKEFFELIKSIGEAKSKQDEAMLIEKQAKRLKDQIRNNEVKTDGDSRQVRELLIRLMYCEMLGQSVPFGYMVVLSLTQVRSRLIDKRIGYICASLFLHPEHSMTTLCVNSFRRDLESTNNAEIDMALTAMTYLLNDEAIPAILNLVLNAMTHSESSVRKKAVLVAKKILQIDINHLPAIRDPIRRALCDVDPAVMAATLNVYSYLISQEVAPYKELVPSLVSILKQVIEHALSREYDYHRIPAPWVQIKILSLLAQLGANDKKVSENMYEIISETLKRADNGINAGHAVVYECIITITKIYRHNGLLNSAAESTGRFLTSLDHNLKYLGLKALKELVTINPAFALKHQVEVIDCLNNPDETIQRKTLDLLYTMTNAQNVTVITEKLLEFLRKSNSDPFMRTNLVEKITFLAEQYAPNNEWFIRTMNKVFLLGGSLVNSKVAYNLVNLLGEGSTGGEDEEADSELRIFAVNSYFEIVEKQGVLSDILTQVIAWTLGEYSYLVGRESEAIDVMCDLMERAHDDQVVRVWIITALTKLVSQTQQYSSQISTIVEKYRNSQDVELQQRVYELEFMIKDIQSMGLLFPLDSACEEISVQDDLAFLDPWINYQVQNRFVPSTPYRSVAESVLSRARAKVQEKTKLKYVYKAPEGAIPSQYASSSSAMSNAEKSIFSEIPTESLPTSTSVDVSSLGTFSKVSGPWGKSGWGAASKIKPIVPTTNASSGNPANNSAGVAPPTVNKPPPDLEAPSPKQVWGNTKKENKEEPPSEEKKLAASIFTFGGADSSTSTNVTSNRPVRGRGARGRGGVAGRSSGVVRKPQSTPSPQAFVPPTQHQSPTTGGSIYDDPSLSSGGQTSQEGGSIYDDIAAPSSNNSSGSIYDMPSTPDAVTPTSTSNNFQIASLSASMGDLSVSSRASNSSDYAYEVNVGAGFDLSNLAPNRVISDNVVGRRLSHPTNQILFDNDFLRVSYVKVFNDNSNPVVVLFSSNKTSSSLTDVNYQITPPACLSLSLINDSIHTASDNKVTIANIPARATAVYTFTVEIKNFEFNIPLVITSSYTVESTQFAKFTLVMSPLDFLRPHAIDIKTYGSSWGSHNKEAKLTIPQATITSADVYVKYSSECNFKTIDVKGLEIVACSKATKDELVLLYAKLMKHQLLLTIRSKDSQLTNAVATSLKHFFSNK
eukprot:TRINITY_DN12256_c0_g1_i1.p1 TRINITY_DN12256_c0_g1~~TRINITY_DN12256_c0_g1_i1.p1  ORF type:complete len:1205 (-),score=382.26 TRINITY_DN12256_c0_g1_i1:22-3636(-)